MIKLPKKLLTDRLVIEGVTMLIILAAGYCVGGLL